MHTLIEPVLYIDEQARIPECFCQTCGGECYGPTFVCLRCERRQP